MELTIEDIGHIEDIRGRLGVEDSENDTRRDNIILKMSAEDRVRAICGWHIGDESWYDTFKEYCGSQGIFLTTDPEANGILQ